MSALVVLFLRRVDVHRVDWAFRAPPAAGGLGPILRFSTGQLSGNLTVLADQAFLTDVS